MSIDLLIQTSTPPKAVSEVGVRKNQKIDDELQILVHLYTTRRTCDKLGISSGFFHITVYITIHEVLQHRSSGFGPLLPCFMQNEQAAAHFLF